MELQALREYFEAPPLSLDEWLGLKRGKASASLIWKVMKGLKNQTALTYVKTLVGESIGIFDPDPYQSPAMIEGSVNELTAMQVYVSDHSTGEVLYGSKIFIPLGENAGVSPDGIELMGEERIYLEVKSPSAPNKYVELAMCHDWETLKADRDDVYWQCVFNMLVLGCQSAKVLVYHPNRGLKVIDVPRIEEDITLCETRITETVKLKLELTEQLLTT